MSSCLWVLVSLCETEINNVDDMLVLASPDQEVVRLQISVKEPILVNELQSLELDLLRY